MKLNRTREEWAKRVERRDTHHDGATSDPSGYGVALDDIMALFGQVDRLTAQLAELEGQEPVAWASSDPTRLNQLISAAQYKSALPKNRAHFDMPLYARFHAAEGKSHDA